MDSLDDLLPTNADDPFTTVIISELRQELSDEGRLHDLELQPSNSEWNHLAKLLIHYVHALKENMSARFSSCLPVLECFSIFDPLNMPVRGTSEFKIYANESATKIAEHFFQIDEEKEDRKEKLLAEWGNFKYELLKWKTDLPETVKQLDPKLTMTGITH